MRMVIWHVDRYNTLGEDDIGRLTKTEKRHLQNASHDDVIVYGQGIESGSPPQPAALGGSHSGPRHGLRSGTCGSGKTYTAVAMAVAALKDRRVKKIVLTRPGGNR